MIQYFSVNVKFPDWKLDKLKSATKAGAIVILKLSINLIGIDLTSFPHILLLTERQISNICKVFANQSSVNTKLSKTKKIS